MTRESILDFAGKYDPQPFHANEEVAKRSIFKGLVASSLHALSECTRVIVQAQRDLAILSGVGMAKNIWISIPNWVKLLKGC